MIGEFLTSLASRWPLTLAVVAALLIGIVQSPEPTTATHNCSATGSPAGPFDLRAYEANSWKGKYARTMELAGHNQLFPDKPKFALPKLEMGRRSAGSSQKTSPYIPPVILKAVAWVESSWSMADWSVAYGKVGPPLVSHSCAYGIMQVLSGMQNFTGVPSLNQASIGSHYAFNVAAGSRVLAEKWNYAPEFRPLVGKRNPEIVENWYYALWSYHGFTYTNHPKNSKYSSSRGVYRCDGTQSYGSFPYQELVLGCVANPPVVDGKQLWKPVDVHLPTLGKSAFSPSAWEACSQSLSCADMDFATPNPSHTDPKTPGVSRGDVLGNPKLALSKGSISMVAVPPAVEGTASLAIVNTGTGPLSWRVKSSASWLEAQRSQGVTPGSKSSTVTVRANANGLTPGTYTAKLTIQSRWASGAPKSVSVTLHNNPDGTLLRGSGSAKVYVMRSGLKRHIPNAATFEVNGYKWPDVLDVPDSVIDSLPTGRTVLNVLADGNLVQGPGSAVYVMEGGARRHIKSSSVMSACGYRWDAVYRVSDARLDHIRAGPALGKPPCPRLSPPDGTLLQGDNARVYMMSDGLRRHVKNGLTFEALGLKWGEIDRVPGGAVAMITSGHSLPNVRADGNLLTGSGGAVYVMQGAKKRHVASVGVFDACGYGWDAVYTVTDERLGSISTGSKLSGGPCPEWSPPGNALLRGSGSAIYVAKAGLKRHVPNMATLESEGLLWGNLDVIPDSVLAALPKGSPLLDVLADGNLLKGSGAAVYVMEGGKKHHITSGDVFNACGYGWDAVRGVPEARLQGIPTGSPLSGSPCPGISPPTGTLLKGSTHAIYVMKDSTRLHISSGDVFNGCDYQSGNVNLIADSALGGIPKGPSLKGPPCP